METAALRYALESSFSSSSFPNSAHRSLRCRTYYVQANRPARVAGWGKTFWRGTNEMRKDTWTWQIVARDCYWRRCYRRPLTLSLPLLLELSYHSSCRHHLCDVTATTGGLQSPSPWPQRLVRCTPYKTYLFCGASNAKAAVRLFPSAFRLLALGIHPWSFSPPPWGEGGAKMACIVPFAWCFSGQQNFLV